MDIYQQLILRELKAIREDMDALRKKEEEQFIALSKIADGIEKLAEKEDKK